MVLYTVGGTPTEGATMLGQTVIYTLAEQDDAMFGQLAQRSYAAIVSAVNDDGTANLHMLMDARVPVMLLRRVVQGAVGEAGRWAPVAA